MKKEKIIVILGQTATGKSDLAVKLAKEFNGEIISADSRQVYKGLNLGTGKITKKEMKGIPHHLLDIINPKKRFSAFLFKEKAEEKIKEIISRKKIPFIVGGTGFYIKTIVDNLIFPNVSPDEKLRKKLLALSPQELFKKLKKIDPERAKTIDPNNTHRLVRSLEIALKIKKVPLLKNKPKYKALQIGIYFPKKILEQRIKKRLLKRIEKGMITEAKKLHQKGLSYKRMKELGLEYKYLALYLQKKISKKEFIEKLYKEILDYARRQKVWFQKDKRIKWFNMAQKNSLNQIKKLIKNFLKNK